jgi:hypothetical protein
MSPVKTSTLKGNNNSTIIHHPSYHLSHAAAEVFNPQNMSTPQKPGSSQKQQHSGGGGSNGSNGYQHLHQSSQ